MIEAVGHGPHRVVGEGAVEVKGGPFCGKAAAVDEVLEVAVILLEERRVSLERWRERGEGGRGRGGGEGEGRGGEGVINLALAESIVIQCT